eukprot:1071774-Prymnesium_polylepis.1
MPPLTLNVPNVPALVLVIVVPWSMTTLPPIMCKSPPRSDARELAIIQLRTVTAAAPPKRNIPPFLPAADSIIVVRKSIISRGGGPAAMIMPPNALLEHLAISTSSKWTYALWKYVTPPSIALASAIDPRYMEKLPVWPPGAHTTPPQRPARTLRILLLSSSMLPPERNTTPPSLPQVELMMLLLCSSSNYRGAVDEQSPARCARVAVGEGDGIEQKLRTVQLKHPRKMLRVEHSTLAVGDQMQVDRPHHKRGAIKREHAPLREVERERSVRGTGTSRNRASEFGYR